MSAEPQCAVHRDVAALGPCSRCGTFACASCFGDGTARLCGSCRARAWPTAEPPAWERRAATGASMPAAFLSTIREVLTRPGALFAGVREGTGLFQPLLFAGGIQLIVLALSLIVGVGSSLASGNGGEALRALVVEHARWGGMALLILPLRLLLLSLVLTPLGFLAGVNAWPLGRTVRFLAYLTVVQLPAEFLPPGGLRAASLLVVAGYGCVGLAAVHQAPLRRAVAAFALLGLSLLFCFVGLYQLFLSH